MAAVSVLIRTRDRAPAAAGARVILNGRDTGWSTPVRDAVAIDVGGDHSSRHVSLRIEKPWYHPVVLPDVPVKVDRCGIVATTVVPVELTLLPDAPAIRSVYVGRRGLFANGTFPSQLAAVLDAVSGISDSVTWSSSDTTVALVDARGLMRTRCRGSYREAYMKATLAADPTIRDSLLMGAGPAALGTGGCNDVAQYVAEASPTCLVPLRLPARAHVAIASNKPFAPVSIGVLPPLTFLLDTGSPQGAVDVSLIERLGFRRVSVAQGAGAGARPFDEATLTPNACFALAGATLPNALVWGLDLSAISGAEGRRVDGLLGHDFFERYVVMIDYVNGMVEVRVASFIYAGEGVAIPVAIEGEHPFATATVRTSSGVSVTGKFLIDTGVRSAITLNRPFAAAHGLPGNGEPSVEATVGVGLGGETRGRVFRLSEVQLGTLRLQDVVAVASLDSSGFGADSSVAGIVGADLLRRYNVILDYPHGRIVLERTPRSDEPFDYDESGVFLTAEGPELRMVRILSVTPHSPADAAGLRPNDILLSVNGHEAGALSLDTIRRRFRAPGVYRLQVKRDGDVFEETLVTRDLLARQGPGRD